MTHTLLSDVHYSENKKKRTIKKGEQVKLISEHGSVAIIEAKNGDRLSVRMEEIELLTQ